MAKQSKAQQRVKASTDAVNAARRVEPAQGPYEPDDRRTHRLAYSAQVLAGERLDEVRSLHTGEHDY